MFEKWAIAFSEKLKKANPEETGPVEALVFGFTILFNLIFTATLVVVIGWLLGSAALAVQVMFSFMLLRLLTGGAHLDQSLACSFTSLTLIILFTFLPASSQFVYSYFLFSFIVTLRYAPYYEEHQLKHSLNWERKKKLVAVIWVITSAVFYYFFQQPGFIFGTLLQAFLLTPVGITFIYQINRASLGGNA